ncbi:relaxase/mobilization nuclease domain-containing protein [Flavobacterium sp. RHBU_3]|uniref:relaxase/mobilization nuclease domain-containing protein n=1 Tax=Flavobacterium sp. RHBU_3 TaxID=3391184 RepID=UPI003984DE11
MVAVIKASHSLSRILRYNEQKITQGVARVIGEKNCPFPAAKVGLLAKLNFLERMASLNTRVAHPGVHISLNFPPAEDKLSDARLSEIAAAYMEEIGFGSQPWMAYRHMDAGHPHIHIVSLKIRTDGSRIDMHNMGRNQSEHARRTIEKNFGLLPAEKSGKVKQYEPEAVAIARVTYGKAPAKKAMSGVLQFVISKYSYTTLGELNAILGLYNMTADRGKVTSRTYVGGGLLYRAIDAQALPVGVPIKASDFAFPATLKTLEKHFTANRVSQAKSGAAIRLAIDKAITLQKPQSLDALQEILRQSGIDLVIRNASNGQVYGLTFVDHRERCSINGSTLGKPYSAKGLSERCAKGLRETAPGQQPSASIAPKHRTGVDAPASAISGLKDHTSPLNALLNPEYTTDYQGKPLDKKKKKKKRKGGQ